MPKFKVEKSVFARVPIQKAYGVVRDFNQWAIWSPWIIAEPDCQQSLSEDGRKNAWDGRIVGTGQMEIQSDERNKAIQYRLTFLKPWKAVSPVKFMFEAKEGGVEITWSMVGSLPIPLFFMVRTMRALVGMDYERGLLMLKDYLETGSVPSKLEFPGIETFEGFNYIAIKTRCTIAGLGEAMEKDFARLVDYLDVDAASMERCFSIYHKWNLVKGNAEYSAGCPVTSIPDNLPEGFVVGEFPSCKVYKVVHTGPYRHLGNAWSSGLMRGRAKLFKQSKKVHPFETYDNDPEQAPENELITNIHFPVK